MLWIAIHFPQYVGADADAPAPEDLAAWASRYTPNVSPERNQGLLLEISGSLRLRGGLPSLVRQLRTDLRAMGCEARLAGAPTARAAWWLSRSSRARFLTDSALLAQALAPLPLDVLDCEARTMVLLRRLGLRTLGELWRLPRKELARRCDSRLYVQLDQALGRSPEARRFLETPPRFYARQELALETTRAEPLLRIAERLLLRMSEQLVERAAGVSSFELLLQHHGVHTPTTLRIGLLAPACDATHLLALLREKLARTTLQYPVEAVCLRSTDIHALTMQSASLFDDENSLTQAWPQLVEQLRARFGAQRVHGIAIAADHRPEYASVIHDIGKACAATARFGARPFWLLRVPQALHETDGVPQFEGPLKLLVGPERIQSGWWDDSQSRDYFIAQTQSQALLWIYRLPARAWYLHGKFA